jgi:hypothetical protein
MFLGFCQIGFFTGFPSRGKPERWWKNTINSIFVQFATDPISKTSQREIKKYRKTPKEPIPRSPGEHGTQLLAAPGDLPFARNYCFFT